MLHLYLVTKPRPNWQQVVGKAVRGGVSIVQLRDKNCTDQEMVEMALALRTMLPPTVPLIINDRLAVAKAVGVGLHVGQQDVSPLEARKQLGNGVLIGLTVHNRVDLANQYSSVIDYVGVGPIFPTHTKPDANPVLGVDCLATIVAETDVSVVAIGGIDSTNVSSVRRQGVAGVAVCSAIMDADDPCAMAVALRSH